MAFGGTIKLTGESEYKKALAEITGNLKVLNSEMKVVTSQYDKNDTSVRNLSQQNDVLSKKFSEQADKVHILEQALEDAERETGENSETSKKWRVELNNAQADLNKLSRALADNSVKLVDAKEKEESFTNQSKYAINNIKDLATEMLKGVAGVSNFGKTIKSDLTERVADAKDKVQSTGEKIKNFGSSISDTVKHPTKLGEAIKGKLVDAVEKLEDSSKKGADAVEELGDEAKKSGEKALSLGDIIKGNLISEGIMVGLKGLASAVKSVGSAFVNIGKQAIDSYAQQEQLVGGVETLFGVGGKSLEEYAKAQGKSVSEVRGEYMKMYEGQQTVLKNASEAYRTAGLSSNEYMETVTSFSASLIQSLDGDTKAAAERANMAIIDMSDNANKMGTSMESIQNAYQGFAKQNYSMLDNLKLGYGGTQKEMYRLLQDAKAIDKDFDAVFELDSKGHLTAEYADIVEAIHIVQTEMGITGTTSLEASNTISGSTGSMKSAWQNLITGIADDNANFGQLVDNLVVSIVGKDGEGGVLNNLLPRIETALDGIVQMVVSLTESLLPQIMQMAVDLINTLVTGISENLPALLESATTILNTLIDGITTVLPTLIPVALQMLMTIVTAILDNLPKILETGIQMLVSLANGIADKLPELIPLAINCILTLVDTLLDNLDLVIDSAINIIMALADGLLTALPDLVEKIPVIIYKLVDAIFRNFPKILDAGIEITLALADGLIKAIPQLLQSLPLIIGKIVNGLMGAIPQLIKAGGDLLSGLAKGLLNPTAIWNTVKGLFNGLVGGIKEMFGIHSPSTVFADVVGKNLALGLGEGFDETMSDVATDMANSIPTEFDADINTNLNAGAGSYNSNYDMMVSAFKQALTEVKVVMNNREMGAFVTNTVERVVYS